ncbi:MAG: hypothetical protein UT39_C0009G0062 [Candidatus Woesebacteria bacterium GW2011_GWA1_39_21]|uniref:Uncharacterized protein n=1 Tax=Candidatus Woesebacteria bacterium GW2011_GWA1_39_21 TaxID=1618550 RepID=A0A0G0RC79_9BACT|nr:MAG: hypothetical protein UT39_C0009G0062 [Candidatus Woesebacteria bacterium GW2011_GWA1_39_21]
MLKNKDDFLTVVAILVLFLTAFVNWTVYSWLILVAATMLLAAWYLRKN